MCEREKKRDALEIEKGVFEREREMCIWQKLREREREKLRESERETESKKEMRDKWRWKQSWSARKEKEMS